MNSPKYDECRNWIKKQRQNSIEWEQIKLARKRNIEELEKFLRNKIEEDFWPDDLSIEKWFKIVEVQKEAEDSYLNIIKNGLTATLSNNEENSGVSVPENERSSWQLYKKHLKDVAGFKDEDIEKIEYSSLKILKQMSLSTKDIGPVKGLVVGNVQSGKTANMAGLMAMAADWGWNFFVILSGTIENLRKQTQGRIFTDLNNEGNLTWVQLDHPSKTSPVGSRAQDLHFERTSNLRYMTVCLKVKQRLEKLIQWMQVDKKSAQNMRILVIDDEADQAGINTGDVYNDSERKTINKLLVNLVHNKTYRGEDFGSNYEAMNYISYTATPYANILNEKGEKTLYPKNFIHVLGLGNEYFGPQQLFGEGHDDFGNLNIIREISDNDVLTIKDIHEDKIVDIPVSLQNSLLWFICSVAVMRFYDYKKPVSMLIHTSQKQMHHEYIYEALLKWITNNTSNILEHCEEIYEKEKTLFSKRHLRNAYPEYGRNDEDIIDYPEFENLKVYINELTDNISSIYMDQDGELNYGRGIHICVDNCSKNTVSDDGMFMRLSYPSNNLGYATAFIVIGGNTLSRGLTIEGLVSTYFLRTVKQADTLMQMGRWFGYRKSYEVLPRIWMTRNTRRSFEYLSDLDLDLREQLYLMDKAGKTPEDFMITLKTSPCDGKFLLTSKNKMQMAETAEIDFSGTDSQMTIYSKDEIELKNNKRIAENFIRKLGDCRKSEVEEAYVWEDIPFNFIVNEFFEKGFKVSKKSRTFGEIKLLAEWIEKNTKNGFLANWNVIVVGTQFEKNSESNHIWNITSEIKLGKIRRSVKIDSPDTVNIGVLTSKLDYVADIKEQDLSNDKWNKLINSNEVFKEYREYRMNAGLGNIPLFLIYCIDKDSKARVNSNRTDLNAPEDMIGIAMLLPGYRGNSNGVVRVKIKNNNIDDGRIDIDEN